MKRFQVIWLAMLLALVTSTNSHATDGNGNGFDDKFERAMAVKFCPAMVLEAGDGHVSPEPVEIMGPLFAAMLLLTGGGEYSGELLTGVAGGAYDYHNYDSWNDAKNHDFGYSAGDYGCGTRTNLTMFWHWDYAGTGAAPGGGNGPTCYQSLSGADYDQPYGWPLS